MYYRGQKSCILPMKKLWYFALWDEKYHFFVSECKIGQLFHGKDTRSPIVKYLFPALLPAWRMQPIRLYSFLPWVVEIDNSTAACILNTYFAVIMNVKNVDLDNKIRKKKVVLTWLGCIDFFFKLVLVTIWLRLAPRKVFQRWRMLILLYKTSWIWF